MQYNGITKNNERCKRPGKPDYYHSHKNQKNEKTDNELGNDKIEEAKQGDCKTANSLIRLIHFIIDSCVWLIIAFILLRIFTPQINALWSRMNRHDVIGYVITFAITFAIPLVTFIGYYFIMEVSFQKTVAKFITRTKVVTNDEKKPKKTAILKRTFCRLIPFVDQVSFLFNRNGFHDRLSNTIVIKLHKNKNKDKEIVKSSTRFFHFAIDLVVWFIICIYLTNLVQFIFKKLNVNINANILMLLVIMFVTFIYFYFMEVIFQKTLSKFITKTKVVRLDGSKPTKSNILIRTFCRLIPFEIFSFLFPKKGCFHDRFSKTMVVFGANAPVWIRMKEILLQQVYKIDKFLSSQKRKYKRWSLIVSFVTFLFTMIYVSPVLRERINTEYVESYATRFFLGVKFLESPDETTRIRGAYNLYELAHKSVFDKLVHKLFLYKLANESLDYREDVCDVLCEHVRKITSNPAYQGKPSDEIQKIMDLLFQSYWIDKNNIFDQYDKNLTGTNLSSTNFYRKKLKNVDFSNATLSEVNFADAELNNVNFKNAKLKNVDFKSKAGYQSADMHADYYRNTKLSDIYFLEAKLDNVDFRDAILNAVDFESAKLVNVNLSNYMSSPYEYKKFSDVNFKGTVLEGYSYNKITENRFTLELTKEKIQETKELK